MCVCQELQMLQMYLSYLTSLGRITRRFTYKVYEEISGARAVDLNGSRFYIYVELCKTNILHLYFINLLIHRSCYIISEEITIV